MPAIVVLKLAGIHLGFASTISCGNTQTLTCPISPAQSFCDLPVKGCDIAAAHSHTFQGYILVRACELAQHHGIDSI